MDPLTLGLIGLGVGLGKSVLIDAPKEARQRKMQAAIAAWSPWTGLRPDMGAIHEADPLGSAAQFGLTGASLGQNIQAQEQAQDINKKYLDILERQSNWGPQRSL